MRKLTANEIPELSQRLETPDAGVWGTPMNANHLDEPVEPIMSHAILHYDIMRPYFRSTRVYARDEAMDILSCADKVTFVTVLTSPERLRSQIAAAELSRKKDSRKLRIREMYDDPKTVRSVYSTWVNFSKPYSSKHLLAEALPTGGFRFTEATELDTLPLT